MLQYFLPLKQESNEIWNAQDRENIVSKLEDEFESMSEVINSYIEMSKNKDIGAGIYHNVSKAKV